MPSVGLFPCEKAVKIPRFYYIFVYKESPKNTMTTTFSNPVSDKPHFDTLVAQYKLLSNRAKSRIRRDFNKHFGLSDDDTTFTRLIGGTLRLCVDEYKFLLSVITEHYEFFISHQKE